MSASLYVHLFAALVALPIGISMLFMTKGTKLHMTLGGSWVILMLGVAISSFWVRDLSVEGPSWIHFLSAFTLFSLIMGIWAIRTGRVRMHRGYMIGTFIGLLGAGAGTLAPGRAVHDYLAGLLQ